MSILDGLMSSFGPQLGQQAAALVAQKMGIDPATAQTAIGALLQQHAEPNDTVAAAADQTGIAPDMMSQIMGHLGGEGALGQLAGALGQGQAGEGGAPAEGGIGGMLGGLMGNFMGKK